MNMNNWDFNLEDKITWDELAPSLQALFKKLQKMIEDEIARAKNAENKLNIRINNIWGSDGEKSSHDITEIWKNLGQLKKDIKDAKKKADDTADTIAKNLQITVGCYGQSSTSTPEVPGHRSDPNALGEWMLKPNGEFGEMHIYRHTAITTNGTDVTWTSLNGFNNLKLCKATDAVYVQFQNKLKEYFISVPNAMCAVICRDTSGNILTNDGSSWSAKVDSWTGGSISCINCIVYSDIVSSATNVKNNPSLNGNTIKIYKVTQNANEWLTLSIPGGYDVILDNYAKDKVYSASEIVQDSQVNINGAKLSTMDSNLPMKFLDDATWLSLIHIAKTESELYAKLP